MSKRRVDTPQETFWAGDFGDEYIERHKDKINVANRIAYFSRIFSSMGEIQSVLEIGANIGSNLKAIHALFPGVKKAAIEINMAAAEHLKASGVVDNVYNESVLDCHIDDGFDLVFTSGFLIHVPPDSLQEVYKFIFEHSNKYIVLDEYYDPNVTQLLYREHEGQLFKRDFPGEMLDAFPSLELVDYKFTYHRDKVLSMNDHTWFLLRKT